MTPEVGQRWLWSYGNSNSIPLSILIMEITDQNYLKVIQILKTTLSFDDVVGKIIDINPQHRIGLYSNHETWTYLKNQDNLYVKS